MDLNGKILTVVIPAYNAQDYLGRCLDSLLIKDRELLRELEVIVVNDGSTDSTSALAHRYAESYPEVFRVIDKENGNSGSCINAALAVATGKYFRELDSDDWFDTKALTAFIKLLEERNEDVVSTQKRDCYINGLTELHEAHSVEYGRTYLFDDLHLKHPREKGILSMHAITYRTHLLRAIGYRQREGIFYSDQYLLYFPMKAARDIYFSDLCVYQYSIGREGQSVALENCTKYKHHVFSMAKELLSDFLAIQDSLSESRRIILLNLIFSSVYVAYRLHRRSPDDDPDMKELKRLVKLQPEMNAEVERLFGQTLTDEELGQMKQQLRKKQEELMDIYDKLKTVGVKLN